MRGLQLYRKHIRNFDNLNQYRRRYEVLKLSEAIRSRERRRAKPSALGETDPPLLSKNDAGRVPT